MKLVIEIPEDVVVDIKDTYTGDDVLYCAVKYGTPFDDAKYHKEHGEVIVAKELWEDAERALRAIYDIKTEINQICEDIKAEIREEKEFAYADFERYKVECLGQEWEDVYDSLPQDDYRYGMERCLEIINKHIGERGEE